MDETGLNRTKRHETLQDSSDEYEKKLTMRPVWLPRALVCRICRNSLGTRLLCSRLHRSIHCSSFRTASGRWWNRSAIESPKFPSLGSTSSGNNIQTIPIQHSNLLHSFASMRDVVVSRPFAGSFVSHCDETASSASNSQYDWDRCWGPLEDWMVSTRSLTQQDPLSISPAVVQR